MDQLVHRNRFFSIIIVVVVVVGCVPNIGFVQFENKSIGPVRLFHHSVEILSLSFLFFRFGFFFLKYINIFLDLVVGNVIQSK